MSYTSNSVSLSVDLHSVDKSITELKKKQRELKKKQRKLQKKKKNILKQIKIQKEIEYQEKIKQQEKEIEYKEKIEQRKKDLDGSLGVSSNYDNYHTSMSTLLSTELIKELYIHRLEDMPISIHKYLTMNITKYIDHTCEMDIMIQREYYDLKMMTNILIFSLCMTANTFPKLEKNKPKIVFITNNKKRVLEIYDIFSRYKQDLSVKMIRPCDKNVDFDCDILVATLKLFNEKTDTRVNENGIVETISCLDETHIMVLDNINELLRCQTTIDYLYDTIQVMKNTINFVTFSHTNLSENSKIYIPKFMRDGYIDVRCGKFILDDRSLLDIDNVTRDIISEYM
jgi:hypothetical protein